jgi:hypothetical protein
MDDFPFHLFVKFTPSSPFMGYVPHYDAQATGNGLYVKLPSEFQDASMAIVEQHRNHVIM